MTSPDETSAPAQADTQEPAPEPARAEEVPAGPVVEAPDDVQVSVVNLDEDSVEHAMRQAIEFYKEAIRLYGTPEDPMSPVWRMRDRRWALRAAEQDLQEYLDEKAGLYDDEDDEDMEEPSPEELWEERNK